MNEFTTGHPRNPFCRCSLLSETPGPTVSEILSCQSYEICCYLMDLEEQWALYPLAAKQLRLSRIRKGSTKKPIVVVVYITREVTGKPDWCLRMLGYCSSGLCRTGYTSVHFCNQCNGGKADWCWNSRSGRRATRINVYGIDVCALATSGSSWQPWPSKGFL